VIRWFCPNIDEVIVAYQQSISYSKKGGTDLMISCSTLIKC